MRAASSWDETTTQLLQRLVQTDSVNPSLVTGGNGESAVAKVCQDFLSEYLSQPIR